MICTCLGSLYHVCTVQVDLAGIRLLAGPE